MLELLVSFVVCGILTCLVHSVGGSIVLCVGVSISIVPHVFGKFCCNVDILRGECSAVFVAPTRRAVGRAGLVV